MRPFWGAVAAVDAKRTGINPFKAQNQGRHYAEQFGAPFMFLKAVRWLNRPLPKQRSRIRAPT